MNEQYTNSPRRRNERGRRAPKGGASILSAIPMLTLVVAFGLVFLGIMGMKGCAAGSSDSTAVPSAIQTEAVPKTETPGDPDERPVSTEERPVSSSSSEPISSETAQLTTEPSTEAPVTEPPGPVMTTVDDRYFADALFLGDSRTDGLYLYSTPGACKHYPFPATSMTIYKIMESADEDKRYGFATTRDLLKGMQFGKIYLMFGINEVGYGTESFFSQYEKVVKEIRSYQPDALIYIQSILYVTQKHEADYPVFATANIKEKNEAIKKLANNVDIFYLEVNDCLNDGTDHLPADYSGDGAHLQASKYSIWHEYLLEHAIVDAKHPWEPETPESSELQQP